MRGLIPSCDAKAGAVEEGFEPGEIRSDRFNVFKWFITVNVMLLIIFCGYALWNLYQLDNVMRSREEAVSLPKYYANRKVNGQVNDTLDFHEWKKSILENLQGDSKTNDSYGNLKVLLRSIGNIMENKKNKLVVANLTDHEVQALKEFTRFRYPRTVVGGPDESECNMQFSLTVTNNDVPVRLRVKPATKGEGMVNIKTTTNYMKKSRAESDIRECSFNIVYQPQNQDENAI
ncbi:uncharacterized protein LOC131669831 [Phymastichus coffea]|uniref:uncharacterized protein LOC131669831 n=1 Tax=Phymastichus coffea TaxID=108790 RepID=UPI00273AD9CD|nr:uncharacterized protein LOC131669831 [Phymastichus coffea]